MKNLKLAAAALMLAAAFSASGCYKDAPSKDGAGYQLPCSTDKHPEGC